MAWLSKYNCWWISGLGHTSRGILYLSIFVPVSEQPDNWYIISHLAFFLINPHHIEIIDTMCYNCEVDRLNSEIQDVSLHCGSNQCTKAWGAHQRWPIADIINCLWVIYSSHSAFQVLCSLPRLFQEPYSRLVEEWNQQLLCKHEIWWPVDSEFNIYIFYIKYSIYVISTFQHYSKTF